MMFVLKKIALFPISLFAAFLALMAKWLLNLSAFVLALPMLYIFGCGLYTLYCREWLQFFDFAGGRVWMLSAHHSRNGHCGSRGMVQRLDCRTVMSKFPARCPYLCFNFFGFAI